MISIEDIYQRYIKFQDSKPVSAEIKEELEELEQLILKSYIFKNIYSDPESYGVSIIPKNLFDVLKKYGPRKVCQYQFKR